MSEAAQRIESLQAELADVRREKDNLEAGFKSFLTNHDKVLAENDTLKAKLAQASAETLSEAAAEIEEEVWMWRSTASSWLRARATVLRDGGESE